MICPCASAIKPRIPTSCDTCDKLPLAPENAIIYTGFNLSKLSTTLDVNLAVVSDQVSITFVYLSTSVISPFKYLFVDFSISFSASSKSCFFTAGTCKSAIEMVTPDFVAYLYPRFFKLLATSAVVAPPNSRYICDKNDFNAPLSIFLLINSSVLCFEFV